MVEDRSDNPVVHMIASFDGVTRLKPFSNLKLVDLVAIKAKLAHQFVVCVDRFAMMCQLTKGSNRAMPRIVEPMAHT